MPQRLKDPGKILDSLARGIIVTDRNWCVQYVNQFLVEGLGTTKEYMVGKDLMELTREFSQREASAELLRALGNITAKPPSELMTDRKSTRLNSSHVSESRMPSSA